MSEEQQVATDQSGQDASSVELRLGLPKRRIGFMAWAAIAFVALVVLPLIAYLSWINVTRQGFEKRLEELAGLGQPVTASGLAEFYEAPAGEVDSTQLYLQAIKVVSTDPFGADAAGMPIIATGDPPLPGQQWDELNPSRDFLAKYESTLYTLHEAAERGGKARYPLNFEDGFLTLLSHAQELRNLGRLLRLDAFVKAHDGDSAGVARAIRSGLAAATSVENEPVLVTQMVSMAVISQVLDTLELLLPRVDFTQDELASLQAAVRAIDVRESWRRAFIGEQAMVIIALGNADQRQMREAATADESVGVPARILATLGSRYDDLTLYTECMERFLKAFDQPWPDAIDLIDEVAADTRAVTSGPVKELRFALTRVCLSIPFESGEILGKGASTEAKLRVADALLAARRYEQSNGQLPTTLDELVPFLDGIPTDPFVPTQPLTVIARHKEFRVYSVGPNRFDDGGTRGDLTGNEVGPDIVMELNVVE